jgi:hypothetical protein
VWHHKMGHIPKLELYVLQTEFYLLLQVTTTINNLILGKLYCNHHGIMHIKGNRQHSCKLKFKEPSLLDRNPRLVCFA